MAKAINTNSHKILRNHLIFKLDCPKFEDYFRIKKRLERRRRDSKSEFRKPRNETGKKLAKAFTESFLMKQTLIPPIPFRY